MSRFYRVLLHLYPSGYRAEYQDELCRVFADRNPGPTGFFGHARRALAAVVDVVPNAAAVHWDILRRDLRHAGRGLRRTPGFALTAILVVALGVGANTAAFSVADFVLLRPLPFPEPDRLVKLWESFGATGYNVVSPANYRDWKAAARSVAAMAAYGERPRNLVGTAEPRRLLTATVTPDLFGTLGATALAGRTIGLGDSANERLVVLSHMLWQSHFGGDRRIVNSIVRLDGEPYTVVGVMPESFRFPTRETDAWTPLLLSEDNFADRTDTWLHVVGRMRDGVTLEEVKLDFAAVAARLQGQYPENKDAGIRVVDLRDQLPANTRLLVIGLCGGALCILLLACANLASLFLARASHRGHELAVRAALGAGRERIARQLVTESLLLALIGGAVGVAVAVAGVPLLSRLVPDTLPTAAQPTLDFRVLGFAAGLVSLTGIAFGVGPALAGARTPAFTVLREGLRSGGGRTRRIRAMLVVTEVAASVVLLVSSGLLLRAVLRIQGTNPGFRADGLVTLRTTLPPAKYAMTARREQFYDQVLREVRALPGVESAAYTTGLPMVMAAGLWDVTLPGMEGKPGDNASLRFVTSQLFATLDIPLRGRDLKLTDTRDAPRVAVVSESFARRWWPNENPLGKQFTIAEEERTIVGVAGDVRVRGLERQSEPQAYLPSRQMRDTALINYPPKDLVIRAASGVALVPSLRRIVRAADPEQPIADVRSMAEIVADGTASRVTQVRVLGILAAIALLIAGVGIHGLLAFTVAQRSREIGVRRALGEEAGSVVRRVLGDGLSLALTGTVVGIAAAYAAARAMSALLAGVRPDDPITIAAAAGLCLVTALVGCIRPAVTASRVDPMVALRGQ